MNVRLFSLWIFSLLFNACNGQQAVKSTEGNARNASFEMVSVPSVITDPGERAEYLLKHYWDRFDFSDTAYIHLPEVTEQAFSNYIDLMKYASPQTDSLAIRGMLNRAATDSTMFSYFAGLYEKYLYDPNSPLRDESLYIYVLRSILEEPVWDEVYKIRPAHLLELALKNRVGEAATDFSYTLADGRKEHLYGLRADYLLLFFYNPDCHACKELTDQMKASEVLNRRLKDKSLKILAVYPDEDLTAWKNHISYMPDEWVNAYDHTVSLKNDEIYDLKAIPTLYLLDKDKKVKLKDAAFDQLVEFLQP